MKTENITGSLKPTSKTASFQLLLAAAASAFLLPLVYPLVANHVLPAQDAASVKGLFLDTYRAAIPVILSTSFGGTVLASVLKTGGKVAAQLAPGVVTDATPNGEGIGSATSVLAVSDLTIPSTVPTQEDDDAPDADSE